MKIRSIQNIIVSSALLFVAAFAPAQAAETAMSVPGTTYVDAAAAKSLFDEGAIFLDPRRNSDYEAGRIPDALHLELKSNFSEASLSAEAGKDDKIVVYCNGAKCARSEKACAKMVDWGFKNVYYFRDGFPAWKAAGYPVE